MAVNVDLVTGTAFYKCYGETGHPMGADGDIRQSVRLQDLPVELRLSIVRLILLLIVWIRIPVATQNGTVLVAGGAK